MTLDVMICTRGADGIERVARMTLPQVEGVRYLVSWQRSAGIELPGVLAARADVTVLRPDNDGLSNNRNHALTHSDADVKLIADDDLIYTPSGLRAVMETFEANPRVDIATFMYDGGDGKRYPETECDLTRIPRGLYFTSFEIAIRSTPATDRLRFDPDFGIGGGRYSHGEECVYMLEARLSGLNCRFFPRVIATHPGLTTGSRGGVDRRHIEAHGAAIAMMYSKGWPLRVPLKAWREWRAGRTPLCKGVWYGLTGALGGLGKLREMRRRIAGK